MPKTRSSLPQGVRFNVFRRDDFRCRYCGRPSPEVVLHCDHVIPRTKGGEDTEDNLVTSCSDCNFGKGTKDVDIERPALSTRLVGYYGHEYEDGKINLQFKIIRKVNEKAYMIQFFEFFFGEPTNTELRTLDFLLGPSCKLYAEHEIWKHTMDRQIEMDTAVIGKGRRYSHHRWQC